MCNCIEEVNRKIAATGRNTELDIPFTWNRDGSVNAPRVSIKTRKLDDVKREKPLPIIPTYCPFCGEAYPARPKERDESEIMKG
jgi:hypothetical protein